MTFTKTSLINLLNEIVERGWIQIKEERRVNDGRVGNTVEDLLGIDENNLPIPNANEWELKTKKLDSDAYTTLLHKEPSPTACYFVPKILLPFYGWPHKESGNKYPVTERSFRLTLSAKNFTDRGFIIEIDYVKKRLQVSFEASKVKVHHESWLKEVEQKVGLGQLNPQPYWGFRDLEHYLGTKLLNSFLVEYSVNKEDKTYFRVVKLTILEGFNFQNFLNLLSEGRAFIEFDARTGHNHGTKIRVKGKSFVSLYDQSEVVIGE